MKRIKKIIAVLLMTCMICSCYSVVAYATDAQLRFSDPSTTVGAEVEVTATFTATDSVQSMDATLTYDTSMLRFIEGTHVQDNGGTLTITGGGDGISEVVSITMRFQALAEGTTVIGVASSSGTDLDNDSINVVNGQSTITIGPGDPSLIQQSATASSSGTTSVEVNGISYTISDDFTDLVIPDGFERSELVLDGVTHNVVKQTTSETILAYLQPVEGDADFFLYNADNASFSVFEQVEISSDRYLIFLDNISGVKAPSDYLETTLSIADSGKEFPAWQNTIEPEYYLVYGLNSDGTKGLYQYDTIDGTYQRFLDNTTEAETEDVKLGTLSDKLLSKLGEFFDVLLIAVMAFILFLLIILIVVSIKLRHRNLELDDLYDEYGIDLDDEEEDVKETRADKKAKKKAEKEAKKGKKSKKSEDDLYDFDDEDDEYDFDDELDEDDYEEEPFKEYNASDYEDDSEIDDLDEMLNARVRVKKAAKRPNMTTVGPEQKRRVGHSEEDDTFKMDLIDLD